MKQNIRLIIQVFGPLKDFWSEPLLSLDVPAGSTGNAILENIEGQMLRLSSFDELKKIRLSKLLAQSVLASSEKVFDAHEVFEHDCSLAVLPPVCGG